MEVVAALGGCLVAFFWRLPLGHCRLDQWHGLLLASVWVLICQWSKKKRASEWNWILAWAVPTTIIFRDAYGIAWLWFATWALVVLAASSLNEDRKAVRAGVLVTGLLQIPFMLLQISGHTVFEGNGSGLWGSLGKRYLLSALFGLCSLWSKGFRAWAWAFLSICTQSVLGVIPALARLLWENKRLRFLLIPSIAFLIWYSLGRTSIRLEVWRDVLPLTFFPVGFNTLPGNGFIGDGIVDRLLRWVDYHSALFELWARFGIWALALVIGLTRLFWKRCGIWISLWAFVLCSLQSIEAYPVAAWFLCMALVGGK